MSECPNVRTTALDALDPRAPRRRLWRSGNHESQVEEEAHAPLETQTQKDAPAIQVIAPPTHRASVGDDLVARRVGSSRLERARRVRATIVVARSSLGLRAFGFRR